MEHEAMRIFDKNHTQFAEFEERGGKFRFKGRGFINRYKPDGFQDGWQSRGQFPVKGNFHLATESPLIHDGSQSILSTGFDFRNSTLTGTTLAGPSGSGQFLLVTISTGRTITAFTSTMSNYSTLAFVYGVCQNKLRPGDAVDAGIFDLTRRVSGSSSIVGESML